MIKKAVKDVDSFIIEERYGGYDPYDALNSDIIRKIPSKFFKLAFTQIFVYSPINFRKIFKVTKNENPKGLGLILRANCNLYRCGILDSNQFQNRVDEIDKILMEIRSEGYSGYSWGYNFPWQDITRYLEKYIPSIVNTSTISNAYLDLYEITKNKRYLDIARGTCEFIINDLNVFENKYGSCFSYTPIDNNVVHNANLMGAEILSRVGSKTGNSEYIKLAKRATDFSLAYQKKDGRWGYSLNPKKGTERMQIDFHQGFVLDSLICLQQNIEGLKIDSQIKKGANFYFGRQFRNGMTLWRYPRRLPKDIHHQAQGVITSYKMYELFKDEIYKVIHLKILQRLIKDFTKGKKVTYQKWFFNNNIQYIRWAHAWTLLGLSYSMKLFTESNSDNIGSS